VRVFEVNLNTEYLPVDAYLGPVNLVGASGANNAPVVDVDEPSDLLTLWRPHAPNASFWLAPGNHMILLGEPAVTSLAEWLEPLLKNPQQTIKPGYAGCLNGFQTQGQHKSPFWQ
jgi:hypothetical protein